MKQQNGFVLVTALVFLLALTALGVVGMTNTAMQEKMAGGYSDRNVAIQASESALSVCEAIVAGFASMPTIDPANGTDGLHLASGNSYQVYYPDNAVWDSTDVIVYSDVHPPLVRVAEQPVCIIEHINTVTEAGKTKEYFRISAYGWGSTMTSRYLSQSIIERQF